MTRSILRLSVALCAIGLNACISRPARVLTALPSPVDGSVTGTYCYRGALANVVVAKSDSAESMYLLKRYPEWPITRRESGFTSIPLYDVTTGSALKVVRDDDVLRITFERRRGGARSNDVNGPFSRIAPASWKSR